MKKILVIGANGFAGRRILDKLSSNGECEVVGLFSSSGYPAGGKAYVCPGGYE